MNRLFEDATNRHSTDGETSAVEQEIERPNGSGGRYLRAEVILNSIWI